MPRHLSLTAEQILASAGARPKRTDCSVAVSDAISKVPESIWNAVDVAPARGSHTLVGRWRSPRRRAALRVGPILGWARSPWRRTGSWPTAGTGEVVDAVGEHWRDIDRALRHGERGLPGGDSLDGLLRRHGPVSCSRPHRAAP